MATQLRTIDTQTLANLSKALVGFDRMFNARLNATPNNYPPHNIIKYDDNHYGIEIAVAGFSKEEINVSVDQNVLTIRGEHTLNVELDVEFLHRGLAARNFIVEFPLAEYMEVRNAEVIHGMLKISIEYIVPEALKPRQIEIK
jgi:molecular chaperone IbpA